MGLFSRIAAGVLSLGLSEIDRPKDSKGDPIAPISLPDREPFVGPNVPDFATGQELFDFGVGRGQEIAPLGLTSRETGLGFLQDPATASQFFEGFQPSNFEQGVADSTFGNMLRRAERSAGHRASLGGIESAFPELFAQAIGPTIGNIGQFLSNQNQRRGELTLQGLLGIDPISQIINPLAGIEQRQDFLQKGTQFDADLEQALKDFQTAQLSAQDRLIEEQSRVGLLSQERALDLQEDERRRAAEGQAISSFGSLLGGGAGFFLGGGLGGASIGAGLGGNLGALLGGTNSPISLGDSLQLGQALQPSLFPGSQQNQQNELLRQLLGINQGVGGGATTTQPIGGTSGSSLSKVFADLRN